MRKLFSLKLYKFILIKFKGYGEKMMNINKKPLFNENGDIIGYTSDNKPGNYMGWLYLHNDGKDWCASYGVEGEFVCLNPEAEKPPYNNACAYGSTPNEALQELYDWCVKNGFVK